MFPNRMEFEKFYVIDEWQNDGIPVPAHIMLNMGRRVIDLKLYRNMVNQAEKRWARSIKERM